MQRGLLWYAVLGGPLAWTAHLLSSYPLVPWVCDAGSVLALHAITVVTMAISLGAAATGAVALRRHPADGDIAGRRSRFMGRVGLMLGLLFALAIAAEGLPPLLTDPCLLINR
jgi:hypothetical protein